MPTCASTLAMALNVHLAGRLMGKFAERLASSDPGVCKLQNVLQQPQIQGGRTEHKRAYLHVGLCVSHGAKCAPGRQGRGRSGKL